MVIETGKYSNIQAFHGSGNGNYYGTIYTTWGNDFDRINESNNDMQVYYRATVNRGNGCNGKRSVRDPAFIINVKSGSYGYSFYNSNPSNQNSAYAGIYVGGYGTGATNTIRDISDRYIVVEGGQIVNILGGLKVTSNTDVDTRIYVKGRICYEHCWGSRLLNNLWR